MIIELMLNLVLSFIDLIFSILPDVPTIPIDISNTITSYIDLIITNGIGILNIIIRPTTMQIAIIIIIFINSFEYIYSIIMWVVRKIPFINLK